jgi:hypothetical protein
MNLVGILNQLNDNCFVQPSPIAYIDLFIILTNYNVPF